MVATGGPEFRVVNTISGGLYLGPVIQARDVTVRLPPRITPALGGLPAPSPAFTGRQRDIERVREVLAPGGSDAGGPRTVLVSAVSGLAGVGKTELAVKVGTLAWQEWGWFPGGVLFTELHGYDPERHVAPEQALEGLLRALAVPGEHVPHTLQDRQRLYRSILAAYAEEGRRILVVIDNAATADQARPLLPADGVNAALVTSRHTLALDARLHDLNVLDEPEAVGMLRETLRVARGDGDTRISRAPEAAGRIARLCAGLPLALSIAASLLAEDDTQDYTAADLVEELESEHTRLEQLSYDERAVRAAFDLSYRRLDQRQARLFRLLPLNPGPDVSGEAAAHLAAVEERDARHLLTRLARAHLIERKPGRRWGMHDLVRLYAGEHGRAQADTDEREAARTRLFTHYRDTAAAASAAAGHVAADPGDRSGPSRFRDREQALRWLDAEHANLVATATTAPRLGHPATATALAFTLAHHLNHRRHFDDWLALTTTALAVVREAGDRRGEGTALNNLSVVLREVRRFGEAVDAGTRAVDLRRETGDHHGEARALANLGAALRGVRRFAEAVEVLTAAADLNRGAGDRRGEGTALNNLSVVLREVRRFGEAVDAGTRAVDLHRETGDRQGEGMALNNLGSALGESGRFAEAVEELTAAADLFREAGDRHGEGQASTNLGAALSEVGRFAEAVEVLTAAADLNRETGDRHGEATVLNNLCAALNEVGRFAEAMDAGTRAVDRYRETSDRHGEGMALTNLGLVLSDAGRYAEAADTFAGSADSYREAGDRPSEAAALSKLGLALVEVGRRGDGSVALERAVAIYRDVANHDPRIESELASLLLFLACLSVDGGRELPAALVAVLEAVELFGSLAVARPESFAGPLRTALQLLAGVLEDLGRAEEAGRVHRRIADLGPPEAGQPGL
ncbi:tetratricopeptide repeat protein [Streptomyces sp. B6B3]|uniref:ATP-binding protein n=1 Tax=Streptomyces sp. B6B3 TaxID=3153570 RepID=UPI00325C881D